MRFGFGKKNVYEGIMEKIRHEIALGILAAGEKLPSCRELAMELGINPNTVQRAYTALEEEGLLAAIPKKGVYVTGSAEQDTMSEAKAQISLLKRAGMTQEQLKKLIEIIYTEDGND